MRPLLAILVTLLFIGFGGHTEQRLRAGEAADDPAAVGKVDLAAVVAADARHGLAEIGRLAPDEQALLQGGVAGGRH